MSVPQASSGDQRLVLPSFGRAKPTIDLTPEQSAALKTDLARKDGELFGQHTVDYGHLSMEPAPARGLDLDWEWHLPGLLYAMLQLDRSIYGLYADGRGETVPVRTHQTQEPLLTMAGARKSSNPWFYTVQGIPLDKGSAVRAFVESYRFKTPDGFEWRGHWEKASILDPFWPGTTRPVTVWVLTCKNVSNGREFAPKPAEAWRANTAVELELRTGIIEKA